MNQADMANVILRGLQAVGSSTDPIIGDGYGPTLSSELIRQVVDQMHNERFDLGYIDRHFKTQKRLLDAPGGFYWH